MFHLFNKVYVESDQRIDINFDRVVISDSYGLPMHKALEDVSYGYLLMHGKNLKDILENNSLETFDDLIASIHNKGLETNKRIMIYLDEEAYKEFITLWFKRIFFAIDASTAWKVISFYLIKDFRQRSVNDSQIYPSLTEEAFTKAFKKFKHLSDKYIPSVYANIKSGLSLELLTASYLYNGSSVNNLCSSLQNILIRSLQSNAIEVKTTVYKHFDKEPFKSKVDVDFFKNSTVFTSEQVGDIGSTSTVNLITSTKNDIDKFKTFAKIVYLEWDTFTEQSSVIKLLDMIDVVRSGIIASNVDLILQFEKTSTSNNRIYSALDEDKINTHLLYNILYSENESLEKLLLR